MLKNQLDEARLTSDQAPDRVRYLAFIHRACANANQLLRAVLLLGALDANQLKRQLTNLGALLEQRLASHYLVARRA